MLPPGKGMFIWNVAWCEEGNTDDIADEAEMANLSHCEIKIADGAADHNIVNGIDLAAELSNKLKARGIQSWGWQYIYLNSPQAEAEKAAERIAEVGVDGFVINAELECKNKPLQAEAYCRRLRQLLPSLSIGLSSYRFPVLHPELPWSQFRSICTFDQPQVYWQGAHNPVGQLDRSYLEFSNMTPRLPFIPSFSAYKWAGWQASPAEVTAFLQAAFDRGYHGSQGWEWYNCRRYLPDVWNSIFAFEWGQPEPPTIPNHVYVNTSTLNIRSEPSDAQQALTVIGTTTLNKRWAPVAIREDQFNREWWECGKEVYLAKWLTRW